MASSYLCRIEALEEALRDGICPPEGCGRCLVLALLAGIRGTEPPRCNSRPGAVADGLNQLSFDQRRALRAALETERDRRKLLATESAAAQTSGIVAERLVPMDNMDHGDRSAHDGRQGEGES
jgi:hypothetical protein